MIKLSIIIPAYNEEAHIEKVIKAVKSAPIKISKEIIVVEDSSQDKTRDILEKSFGKDKEIKLIYQPRNQGKGAAIRRGLKDVMGDIVLIQDADLEYSVTDYPKILEPIINKKAQVVYGSRFKGDISGMKWTNLLANKILAFSANILFGIRITDEATAYKVFDASVIKSISLKCERFEFCPEITAKVAKRGIKIYEVPIIYHGRTTKDGKKITWKDGFEAIWTLVKYRFKD